MNALVVEDEISLQILYERILSKSGYNVIVANDGYFAIQIIEEGLIPDLIILDMRLPNFNGAQVLEYLEAYEHINQVHVIIASASSGFEHLASQLPSCEILRKPVLASDLLAIMARVHG